MADVRITVDLNTESGEYSILFNNISNPGVSMDAGEIFRLLREVTKNVEDRVDCVGEA